MNEIVGHRALEQRIATLTERARRLNARAARPFAHPLVFMTDGVRIGDPETVAAALPADALVVFRDYDAPDRAARARRLRAATRGGAKLLVAGDAALAAETGADGVHLPERLLAEAGNLRTRRADWIVTTACHCAAALDKAARAGADAAFLSPVFPTRSHPGAAALGVEAFADLVADAGLPTLALGGVDLETADTLEGTGCAGFAAIGAFKPEYRPTSF